MRAPEPLPAPTCILWEQAPVLLGWWLASGEFMSYALRLASGCIADRTRAHWPLTFVGYGSIISIPLAALVGYWQLAAVLIILERVGKAIGNPARDTMLSYATKNVGRGWGFAVHEALDQVGVIIGPAAFSLILLSHDTYQEGFAFMWIPALVALAVLGVARKRFPSPVTLETPGGQANRTLRPSFPEFSGCILHSHSFPWRDLPISN